MATINRWPLAEAISLRDAMDQLLEQSVVRPRGNGAATNGSSGAWRMPLDVYETPHEFVIRGWAPGVQAENMAITWDQGTLTVRGTIPSPYSGKEQAVWHARELYYGDVFATISLPGQLDVDKAEANFEAGVLTLRVPKAEAARPRQIRVTVGKPAGA